MHDVTPFRKTSRQSDEQTGKDKAAAPIKFAVRSLGWVPIAEEDLTPERSSKAVNKCIVDLSLGRNDINDGVGRWGDVSHRSFQLLPNTGSFVWNLNFLQFYKHLHSTCMFNVSQ